MAITVIEVQVGVQGPPGPAGAATITAGDGLVDTGIPPNVDLNVVGGTGIIANADDIELDTAVTDLLYLGITDTAADSALLGGLAPAVYGKIITITAGDGLTDVGTATDPVFNAVGGSGITVTATDIQLDTTVTDALYLGITAQAADSALLAGALPSVYLNGQVDTVTAGLGLIGLGTATDPIIDVGAGSGITVAANSVAVDTTFLDTLYLGITDQAADSALLGGQPPSFYTAGQVNTVGSGAGLIGTGTATDPIVNVGAGTGITVNADDIEINTTFTDTLYLGITDTAADSTLLAGQPASFYNTGGTVTSVGAGAGLADSGTATDPVLDIGSGTGITVNLNNIEFDTTFGDGRYLLIAAQAADAALLDGQPGSFYNTGGTVTSVGAGAGLADSGTATDPVIDVGAGTGITVNLNDVAFDTTFGDGRYLGISDQAADSALLGGQPPSFYTGGGGGTSVPDDTPFTYGDDTDWGIQYVSASNRLDIAGATNNSTLLMTGLNNSAQTQNLFSADPSGDVQLFHSDSLTEPKLLTADSGIQIRGNSTNGTGAGLTQNTRLSWHNETGTQISNFGYFGVTDFTFQFNTRSSDVLFDGTDSTGAINTMALMDPDAAVELYYDGDRRISTTLPGALINGNDANNPATVGLTHESKIDFQNTNNQNLGFMGFDNAIEFEIHSASRGADVVISGLDAAAVDHEILRGDPDSETAIFHDGTLRWETTANGTQSRGSTAAAPTTPGATHHSTHIFANSSGSTVGTIGFINSINFDFRSQGRSNLVRMVGTNASGQARVGVEVDPDGDTTLLRNTELRVKTFVSGTNILGSTTGVPSSAQNNTVAMRLQNQNEATVGEVSYNNSINMELINRSHGGEIQMRGENAAGSLRTIFSGDPDAGALLRYAGSLTLETVSGGAKVTGDLEVTGTISEMTSDIRLKNIEGRIIDPLDKLDQINGIYFRLNEKGQELTGLNNDRRLGLIAQELQEVFPEVVKSKPGNPDYKTVKYDGLIPVLVEAVKELSDENRRLNEQIEQIFDYLKMDPNNDFTS